MSQLLVLDHSMFETDKFECLNFWLADQDGCYQVSHTFIETLGLKDAVLANYDKRYLNMKGQGLVYGGLMILEIQWG